MAWQNHCMNLLIEDVLKSKAKKKGTKYIEYFIQKSEYFILLILFHFKHTFFIKSLFVCVCVFQ